MPVQIPVKFYIQPTLVVIYRYGRQLLRYLTRNKWYRAGCSSKVPPPGVEFFVPRSNVESNEENNFDDRPHTVALTDNRQQMKVKMGRNYLGVETYQCITTTQSAGRNSKFNAMRVFASRNFRDTILRPHARLQVEGGSKSIA
jgi:hypothetical protein